MKTASRLLILSVVTALANAAAAEPLPPGVKIDFRDAVAAAGKLRFNPAQWQIADGELRTVNAVKQMAMLQFAADNWHGGEIKFALKRLAATSGDQHFGLLFGDGKNQFRLLCRGGSLEMIGNKVHVQLGKLPRPLPVGPDAPWSEFGLQAEGRTIRVRMDGQLLCEQVLPASLSGPVRLYAYHVDIAVGSLEWTSVEAPNNQLVFRFDHSANPVGWNKTSALTTEPAADGLKLHGSGWDAKIYRQLHLPAGYYTISACGRGRSLSVQLTANWTPQGSVFNLNLSRENDQWRTDWRPFALKSDAPLFLVVAVSSAKPVTSAIKYIKIEPVPEPVEPDLPTVDELKKQRPEPEIVRGCTMPNAKDFPDIKKLHANVTRHWLRITGNPKTDDAGLKQMAEYLEAARKSGLKTVIVLGGGAFGKAPTDNRYWTDPKLNETVAARWKMIAERLLPYRDAIYAYDLYNEPLDWSQMPNPPRQWREAAKAAIKAIRSVDRDTWIMFEPGPGGMHWGFAGMKPLPDTRIIYSLHFYSPHEFTHQGVNNIKGTDLKEALARINVRYPGDVNGLYWDRKQIRTTLEPVREFQRKYQVPILVGEFSVIRWAPKQDAVRYLADLIDLFEEYRWSWIYHGFRENPCWSVEHDETVGTVNDNPPRAAYETERAKVLKKGLAGNANR